MNTNFDIATYLGISPGVLIAVAIWSLIWMGVAMWKSARKNQMVWFVIFLLVHTVGILEILYIFVFSKISRTQAPVAKQAARKKRR